MAKRERTHWRFFVDEGGQFEDLTDAVVVAGVLIRGDVPAHSPAALREALYYAAPDIPWPLHTNRLTFPVLLALAAFARRDVPSPSSHITTAPRDSHLDNLADRAVRDLRRTEPERTGAAMEALCRGRIPEWKELFYLDRVLACTNRTVHRGLNGKMRGVRDILRQICAAVMPPPLDQAVPSGLLFACGEYCDGDAAPAGDVTEQHRAALRYTNVLRELIQRVKCLLSHLGGRHQVWVHVLTRDHVDPFLGRVVDLHLRHVAQIISDVVTNREDDPVRIIVEGVPAFDRGADPALVLADFAAHHARHGLRPPSVDLAAAASRLDRSMAAIIRAGTPPLPLLTALGTPDSIEDETRARRWAIEQARECAAIKEQRRNAL